MTKNTSDKIFAFINSKAGTCEPDVVEGALREQLGVRLVGLLHLHKRVDVEETLKDFPACDATIILVAGGDGSVTGIARHLVDDERYLFIVPCGTANNLAKHLGIPLKLSDAIAVADHYEVRALDAMQVGKQTYFSHLSAGIYANAAKRTDPKIKAIFGRLAHLWQGLRGIWQHQRWHFRLQIDDQDISVKASTLMVANVGSVGGGGLEWGKDIRADDGVLDVCAIHARAPSDYLGLIWDFVRFRRPAEPQASYWKARSRVVIEANHSLALRGDGEDAGNLPADVRLRPGVLKVIVPSGSFARRDRLV